MLSPFLMFDGNISQVLPCSMLHNKVCMLLNHVWLFSTPWIVACQALLSMGFFRQEYWSGLPFPSPGNLPNPGMEPGSHALQADSLLSKPPGGSMLHNIDHLFLLKPPTMFLPSISWVNIIKKIYWQKFLMFIGFLDKTIDGSVIQIWVDAAWNRIRVWLRGWLTVGWWAT